MASFTDPRAARSCVRLLAGTTGGALVIDREEGYRTATVEAHLSEPALVAATFDLLRTYARANNLHDIGRIAVTLNVEFQGRASEEDVQELSRKLEDMWLGEVVQLESREWAKRKGEKKR